ncbi:putative integrase core domain protein [Trichinella spiralis]|uniref:putative integrase core domain protein n=1 Tax=Trichinella spiralis TaxID=6334 RepID=UPI0001EFEAFB|nr:putative integrase core domain protein [Trichinella spiralis]
MAATAKARSRKLTLNKARLNRLLTELEELCIDAVNDDVLVGQLELTEVVFRETDALHADRANLPKLWQKGLNWDDELPSDLQKEWQTWKLELCDISDIRIPTCLIPFHGSTINKVELHTFGDASETAYGVVVNLVVTKEDHSTISNLVMAKSRDEPLTSSIAEDWSKWKREAKNLWKIKIPRCLISFPVEETDSIELHVYGDTTKWTYGAVAYLKVISKDKTTVRFIMSKSRVAPLKTITLPRLEHMAALIAANWIRSETKNWKPFVRNRVELIQQLTEPKLWKYCPSENNPADLISRGTSVTKLKDCQLWWEGLPSLLNPEPCESEKTSEESTQHPDALEARCLFGVISPINDDQFEYVIDPSRFQTFSKLTRVTAWCLRFAKNCRHASKQRQEELTIEERNEAELYWMKAVQNETFRDEKSLVMKGELPENSRLIHLSPFIDEFGVIRVGGRLQQSNLLYQHKHPVILRNRHNITDLIIQGEHKHQWHAGVEQTLVALRQRFWILKGRSTVKIDFAGPLYVKEGRTISKIYICLFTCMATRAIHLEPSSDMTAQSFLAAFRRFISRRGKPSVVQTDNFRTFKLADKYIQDLFRGDEKQKIARALTEEKVEWRFSCERSPWCGGYWERLVRSVKTALRKVLAKALVSREELVTILCEMEARINAIPLTTISDDSNDLEPLTPFHFLTGRTLMELPDMTTKRLVGKESTSTTMTLR